ncbi:hypothetical protein LOAG_14631, partial [Loa loa]
MTSYFILVDMIDKEATCIIHINIYTHTQTYTPIHAHTHTYTCVHTQLHTYTHITYTDTHTYIHVHVQIYG